MGLASGVQKREFQQVELVVQSTPLKKTTTTPSSTQLLKAQEPCLLLHLASLEGSRHCRQKGATGKQEEGVSILVEDQHFCPSPSASVRGCWCPSGYSPACPVSYDTKWLIGNNRKDGWLGGIPVSLQSVLLSPCLKKKHPLHFVIVCLKLLTILLYGACSFATRDENETPNI